MRKTNIHGKFNLAVRNFVFRRSRPFRSPPTDYQGFPRCNGYSKEDFTICSRCKGNGEPSGDDKEVCSLCGGYGDIPVPKEEMERRAAMTPWKTILAGHVVEATSSRQEDAGVKP